MELTTRPTSTLPPPALNWHGDHVATCLCCVHYASSFDAGYSDETPGIGHYVYCEAKHFTYIKLEDQHEAIHRGQTCPDFVGLR